MRELSNQEGRKYKKYKKEVFGLVNLDRVVENLISLSENKYEQLKEIYVLTEQQANVIEELEIDKLMELIDKKQVKIDCIKGFDSQVKVIEADLKTLYDVETLYDLNSECDGIMILKDVNSKIADIIHQIREIESLNSESLEFVKSRLEDKMASAKVGKIALKSYGGFSGYSDAVFFDKKIK